MSDHTPEAVVVGTGMPTERKRDTRKAASSLIFLAAIGFATLGPLLVVIVQSFDVSDLTGTEGFGLQAWQTVFGDTGLRQSILNSFILSLRVPIGLVVAFISAWLLIRVEVPGRRFLEICFWFGFLMPNVPLVTGWILLLDGNSGLLNFLFREYGLASQPLFNIHSMIGIVWAHLSINTVPIIILLLTPAFRQFDAAQEEAARVSGAGPARLFLRIVVPAMLPAALVAALASFIRSLESFEIEAILGTPAGIFVYSTKIYDILSEPVPQFSVAMALSTVFLLVLIALAAVHRGWFLTDAENIAAGGKSVRHRMTYPAWLRWGGSIAMFILVAAIFIAPFCALIAGSFMRLFGFFDLPDPWTTSHWIAAVTTREFLQAAANTVLLGLMAACAGVLLYAVIGWMLVRSRLYWRGFISFLVWLPWALPGLVLGMVILYLTLNVPGFGLLHGTMFPVIFALLVKELPIGVQIMRVAVVQSPRQLEDAARVAGASEINLFFRVTLPLLAPAMLSVFLIIFAATVQDISTIVLIAPPDLQTLSLLMFRFASIGSYEAASVIGTIIALLSLLIAVTVLSLGRYSGLLR